MHQKNIDHIAVQGGPRLHDGLHHAVVVAGQRLGADHHIVKFMGFQGFADIRVSPVILRGIDKVDAVPEGIAENFGPLLHRQSQLARSDGQYTESNFADLDPGLSQLFLFHR